MNPRKMCVLENQTCLWKPLPKVKITLKEREKRGEGGQSTIQWHRAHKQKQRAGEGTRPTPAQRSETMAWWSWMVLFASGYVTAALLYMLHMERSIVLIRSAPVVGTISAT